MFEMFYLMTRNKSGTGPGSSQLVEGTNDAGWFGEVVDDFFTIEELIEICQFDSKPYNYYAGKIPWQKGIFQGRVIYFPTAALANMTWNDTYRFGIAFGEEGPGRHYSGSPVDQFVIASKVINGKVYRFKVRLPQLTLTGDIEGSTMPENLPPNEVTDVILKAVGHLDEWVTAPQKALSMMTNATPLATPANTWWVSRQANAQVSYTSTPKSANLYWVPVLELVDLQDYFESVKVTDHIVTYPSETYASTEIQFAETPIPVENIANQPAEVYGVQVTYEPTTSIEPVREVTTVNVLTPVGVDLGPTLDSLSIVQSYTYKIGIFDHVDLIIETV